jgi:TolB protein
MRTICILFMMFFSFSFGNVGVAEDLGSSAKKIEEGPIYIDVGVAGARKFRIAVAPLVNEGGQVLLATELEEFGRRLEGLFGFLGSFDVVPRKGFLAKPDSALRPIDFEEWKGIKAEGVIFGKFSSDVSGKVKIDLRFFDAQRRTRLVGKLFSRVAKSEIDVTMRRFADLCIQALTGEMGIFSSQIAFVAAKKPGEFKQVFIANFDGSEPQQITFSNTVHMSPSWSPDGTKLTFTSFQDGKAEIYLYNVATRKVLRMTRSVGNNSGSNWSPDAKTIAFSGAEEGRTSIFTMRAIDGGGRAKLIGESGLEVEPAYSPDGRLLAFASGRFGNPHIFVRDLVSGKDTRITTAGWYNSSPQWRPDGLKLAFAGYDREIDRYDIFIVNPDGSRMERLTLDQGDNEKPTWSPDGRYLIFQSNRATSGRGKTRGYKLYSMNKDGGNPVLLNTPFYDVSMPAWGPRRNLLGD